MSGTDWFALIGGSIVMISFAVLFCVFQAARQRAPNMSIRGEFLRTGNALCMAKS